MDVSEIRYRNFESLFDEFKEEVRQKDPDAPEKGMLKLFGERLGIRQAYMSHINTKYKNIGSEIARQIEQSLKLSHGWMDHQHERGAAAQPERAAVVEDGLRQLFEWCRQKDAAKTHATLLSLLGELTAAS